MERKNLKKDEIWRWTDIVEKEVGGTISNELVKDF